MKDSASHRPTARRRLIGAGASTASAGIAPNQTQVPAGAKGEGLPTATIIPARIGRKERLGGLQRQRLGEGEEEEVDIGEDEEAGEALLSRPKNALKIFGGYQGLQFFLTVLWAFGWGVTLWAVRNTRVDHDQLRTPSHELDVSISYRYWVPAWWALALPVFFRTCVLYFSGQSLMRPFDAAPRVGLTFLLWAAFAFEIFVTGYLLLERNVIGCNYGAFPWLICHDERWCHPHYKEHAASCSNYGPLIHPPLGGLRIRHEWRVMVVFSLIHLLLALFLIITVRRSGNTKPSPFSWSHLVSNYKELVGWHWFLLLAGLGSCAIMYVSVATRMTRMDYKYVRSPSDPDFDPFLSSRYGVVWIVHALGVISLPMALFSGVYMLLAKKWSVMAADTHRFGLLFVLGDAILRLILCIVSLHTCNGAMQFWSNTCNSRRLCCLRFDEWPGNKCAGVGLLYGNTTTPENDIWACDPPLLDVQQLDRDSGFTWTFVLTGFSLLWATGLLWNWGHLRAWRRELDASRPSTQSQ